MLYNFLLTKVSLFKIPKQETVRYLEVRLKRTRTISKNSSLLQEASPGIQKFIVHSHRVQFSYFTIIVFQPCSILNSTQLESEDGRDNSERGKYSIEDANHPRPSSSDGMSFENVIKDRDELEGFQKYLEKKDPKGSACFLCSAVFMGAQTSLIIH